MSGLSRLMTTTTGPPPKRGSNVRNVGFMIPMIAQRKTAQLCQPYD